MGDSDMPTGGESAYSPFVQVGVSDETRANIEGLVHSTVYEFVIRAVNVCGPGPQSLPSPPVRTLGKPSGPCAAPLP